MNKGTKICKVCGKEYEYCHTKKKDPRTFRWQDVACCPEHGEEYLALVIASRTESVEEPAFKKAKTPRKKKQFIYEPVKAAEEKAEEVPEEAKAASEETEDVLEDIKGE